MKNLFSKQEEKDSLIGGVPSLAVPAQEEGYSDVSSQDSFDPKSADSLVSARTFQVQYDAYWNAHTTIHITDTSTSREVYTIDTKYRKPQVRIRNNNAELATSNFHTLKSNIDVTLAGGQKVTLEACGIKGLKCLATKYSYVSPARNGERMMWKPRRKLDDLNMVLLNGSGLAIARYKPNYKGKKRGGMLEMTEECFGNEQVMEEVVVVALTLMHYKESQRIMAATSIAPVVVTS